MRVDAPPTDRRKRPIRWVALTLALAGVLHFVLSLVTWGLFYVGSYRHGWRDVLTLRYGAQHLAPAVGLLGLFASASWSALRRRRFALPLAICSVLLSAGVFAVEARGDPQFQRVWYDSPTDACSNRQSYYCTWWWWQPTRH